MKERPILFSAPMVRALLDGTKTQTRRVMKPQPPEWAKHYYRCISTYSGIAEPRHYWASHERSSDAFDADEEFEIWPGQDKSEDPSDFDVYGLGGFESPFGSQENCIKKAARLWVRETFFAWGRWETRYSAKKRRDEWHFVDMTLECGHAYCYAADEVTPVTGRRNARVTPMWWKRPAIFMPRAASRIDLEVTEVRVERLHDISEADAIAEGIERNWSGDLGAGPNGYGGEGWVPECGWRHYLNSMDGDPAYTAVESYSSLWEQINGAGSWAANPWVWVVAFKVVRP